MAVCGMRSLDALLEGAAVCYATEDARNILRVINVAEAVKSCPYRWG